MSWEIQCPKCGTEVPFTQSEIMNARGSRKCPGCGAEIFLEADGKTPAEAVKDIERQIKKMLKDAFRGSKNVKIR